jgi:hypothetical protein
MLPASDVILHHARARADRLPCGPVLGVCLLFLLALSVYPSACSVCAAVHPPSGLYFSFCLDMNDNELVYLESIHLFVELLDKFFASVCELDLVFNFHKIFSILDEIYLAGEVQETSKRVILERLEELGKLE